MARSAAYRKYQITINNPADNGFTHDIIKNILSGMTGCLYWCMCDEIGHQGTPHTHLYVVFKNAVMFQTMQQRFPALSALVCGFSAGGHLAASLGVHWDDPALAERCGVQDASVLRPDAMVLGYPVITAGQYAHRNSIVNVSRASGEPEQYWSLEENVSEKTPPTFLWHTMTDNSVPVENSLLFVQQLHRYGVACECHLFESGRHGMSVATREVDAASRAVHAWVGLCQTWLSARFGPLGGDAE